MSLHIQYCILSNFSGEKLNQLKVAQQIKAFPEVEEVSIDTGETDLVIKVSLGDVNDLNSFVVKKLRDIDGVEKTITSVVLSEV
ncbi:MAG: Lrp/AsnC ligand binding domain-containing protein [Candidatus Hodarchaeales archaeon]